MEPRAWAGDTEGERMSVPTIQKMLVEALREAEGEFMWLQWATVHSVAKSWTQVT